MTMPETADALPALAPDEVYRRFNKIIAAGVFPDRSDAPTVYSWASYAMALSGTIALEACASTSITSAGLHLPDKHGGQMDTIEAIQGNISHADRLLQTALSDNSGVLSAQTTLNPGMMGKLHTTFRRYWLPLSEKGPAWSQQDYLRVCFSHILGLRASATEEPISLEDQWFFTRLHMTSLYAAHDVLTEAAGINQRMNDKSLPEAERLLAYLGYSASFLDCVNVMAAAGHIELRPLRYIIKLIGARSEAPHSLGVGAELALARDTNILPLELALAGDQWNLRQLGDIYTDLQERDAPFAAPVGRLALALSRYEPPQPLEQVNTQPVDAILTDPITAAVRAFYQNVSYPGSSEVRDMLAYYFTRLEFAEARHIFAPAVVKQLLHDEYPPQP